MVTRHSKHIPMPQNAVRGSPVTEVRQGCPLTAIATATVVPSGIDTASPLTRNVISSGMNRFRMDSRR